MNSLSALVTAAFLVRSPLTARARSSRSGSIDRFVAMCDPLHTWLHISGRACNISPPSPAEVDVSGGCQYPGQDFRRAPPDGKDRHGDRHIAHADAEHAGQGLAELYRPRRG